MILTLTLVLASLGQSNCAGGRCFSPAYAPPIVYQNPYQLPPIPYQRSLPVKQWYKASDGRVLFGWLDEQGSLKYWPQDQPAPKPKDELKPSTPKVDSGLAVSTDPLASKPGELVLHPKATASESPKILGGVQTPAGANYGLDLSKIFVPGQGERYQTTGAKGDEFVAQARAGGTELPDDSKLPRVVIISPDAPRRLARIREFDGLRGAAVIEEFSPEEWQVADVGMSRPGKSDIVIQEAGGKVVERMGIDSSVEQVKAAVRRAQPKYNAEEDPGVSTLPGLPNIDPTYLVGGAIAVAAFLILRDPKPKGQ